MTRCCVSLLLTAWMLVGCAFDDGQPWGELRFHLKVRFDPSPRLDEDGRVRTTTNYAVRVEQLQVRVDAATLGLSSGGGALTLDPASPPAGYTLCHNGHCHSEEGRLVSYEDVQLALAQGAGGGPTVTQVYDALVAPTPKGVTLEPGACSADCQLDARGQLRSVRVGLSELRLTLRVFDQLTGDDARLPPEGVGVAATVPLDLAPGVAVSGKVDADAPVGVALHLAYAVPPQLFDGIDWALLGPEGLSDSAALAAALSANLDQHGTVEATVERFDP